MEGCIGRGTLHSSRKIVVNKIDSIYFIPKLKTRQTTLAGWKVLILVLLL